MLVPGPTASGTTPVKKRIAVNHNRPSEPKNLLFIFLEKCYGQNNSSAEEENGHSNGKSSKEIKKYEDHLQDAFFLALYVPFFNVGFMQPDCKLLQVSVDVPFLPPEAQV